MPEAHFYCNEYSQTRNGLFCFFHPNTKLTSPLSKDFPAFMYWAKYFHCKGWVHIQCILAWILLRRASFSLCKRAFSAAWEGNSYRLRKYLHRAQHLFPFRSFCVLWALSRLMRLTCFDKSAEMGCVIFINNSKLLPQKWASAMCERKKKCMLIGWLCVFCQHFGDWFNSSVKKGMYFVWKGFMLMPSSYLICNA